MYYLKETSDWTPLICPLLYNIIDLATSPQNILHGQATAWRPPQFSQEIPGSLLACSWMAATGPPSTPILFAEIIQKLFRQQSFGGDQQRSVIMSTGSAFPGDPREPVGRAVASYGRRPHPPETAANVKGGWLLLPALLIIIITISLW